MSTIEVGKILVKTEEVTNGVDIFHSFYHAGKKEIKYITFYYLAYNSVNDIVACTASEKTEVSAKLTGPISPSHDGYVEWKDVWYNPTVSTVVITKICIQYMDNTEEIIDGKDIVSMLDERSAYYRDVAIPRKKAEAEAKKVKKAVDQLYGDPWKMPPKEVVESACSAVFLEFKNDQKLLLKVLDKLIDEIKNSFDVTCDRYGIGYIIGDYIEKECWSNEELMKKAVLLWKGGIA